jgi:hypothetical protein
MGSRNSGEPQLTGLVRVDDTGDCVEIERRKLP